MPNYSLTYQKVFANMAMDYNQPGIYLKLFLSQQTGIAVHVIEDFIQKSLKLWHKTDPAIRYVSQTVEKSITTGSPLECALKSDNGERRILEGLLCHEISRTKKAQAERARSVLSATKTAQPQKPIKKRDISMISPRVVNSDEEELVTTTL